jgi:DNA-binding transcriptional ArsR family regulator
VFKAIISGRTGMKGSDPDVRAARIAREQREDDELRLARGLGHPRRVAIVECLNSKGPMAPVEVAQELRAELSNLSYHFRVLAEAGLIEDIAQEKVRGSVKTTYRSTARALLRDSAWSSLSPTTRASISATMFQVLATRVGDALQAGTFDSKDSRHLSISTIAVDQEGWEEVSGLLASVFNRLDAIQQESSDRGGGTLPMSVGLLGFESPRRYE